MLRLLVTVLLCEMFATGVCFGEEALDYDATRLYIGQRRQFFFDNLVIQSMQNLTRRAHPPGRLEKPLISSDKPWEHTTYFTCNAWRVLRDPADGVFKCWYEDLLANYEEWTKAHDWRGGPAGYPSRCLFARSENGVEWEKPELGIVIEDGHNTNIVYGGKELGSVHAPFVLLDPLEKDPQHRFEMLFNLRAAAGTNQQSCFRWAWGDVYLLRNLLLSQKKLET